MTEPPFPDAAGKPTRELTPAGWDARWRTGDTPWDLGRASPPLVRALGPGGWFPPPVPGETRRALVPGCGAGHDARAVAAAGWDTVAIDVSPLAVGTAARQPAPRCEFRVADLFALPGDLRDLDLVVEHTCFCAIDPSDRDRYVDAVADALRPGGLLLALFWLITTEKGPPFGATREEIGHRFSRRFTFEREETPADSEPSRPRERLCLLRRAP